QNPLLRSRSQNLVHSAADSFSFLKCVLTMIQTPCVGICSTVYGDMVCRGCKRFAHEVIAWNSYTPEQKILVWHRLDHLLQQVLESKLRVTDATLIQQSLKTHGIRFRAERPAICLAWELLRHMKSDRDVSVFGFELKQAGEIAKLVERINQDFHRLSEAWFEKNCIRALTLVAGETSG
ncbi:MAG TPA: DUF1289 domain-containing protein, partial [Pseudomonadales bacterium]|nr:DUF1289 domain-containing protein [Pseudomonadales bacterium]